MINLWKIATVVLLTMTILAACHREIYPYEPVLHESPVADIKIVLLPKDLVQPYDKQYERGLPFTVTLLAGRYVAKFQTNEGVYYEGPGQAVVSKWKGEGVLTYKGGFFIPRVATQPVRFWFSAESRKGWDNRGWAIRYEYGINQGKIVGGPYYDNTLGLPFGDLISNTIKVLSR